MFWTSLLPNLRCLARLLAADLETECVACRMKHQRLVLLGKLWFGFSMLPYFGAGELATGASGTKSQKKEGKTDGRKTVKKLY